MSITSDILNVTEGMKVGDTITKYMYHIYQPLASTRFTYNDEIRFQIHQQDVFTLPSESFFLVQGKIIKGKDDTQYTSFVQNGISFLFDEIRYEINGKEVDKTRNLGFASLMKGLVSFTTGEAKSLINAGWYREFNTDVLTSNGEFSACIPLKIWLGFAEDYKKILTGVRQELILLRARNDYNALHLEAGSSCTVEIGNISWYVPHITVSDAAKISLMKLIDRDTIIKLPFRSWEFQENPLLNESTRNNWTVMSTSQLEKPRYVILGFQTDRKNQIKKDNNTFDHISLKDIKLYLNSESYPYTNLNLDPSKNDVGLLYNMYLQFQRTYYGRKDYNVTIPRKEFLSSQMLIVFDCSHQNDSIKTGPVDIRIEIETATSVPAKTCCYCLILHDRIVQYSSLSGIVKKL